MVNLAEISLENFDQNIRQGYHFQSVEVVGILAAVAWDYSQQRDILTFYIVMHYADVGIVPLGSKGTKIRFVAGDREVCKFSRF